MIKAHVSYTDEEQPCVSYFNSINNPGINLWQEKNWVDNGKIHQAAFANLKLRIKGFYISEQGYTCCYCQNVFPVTHKRAWDLEHIVSRHEAPRFMLVPQNLAVSCIDCNGRKSNKSVLVSLQKNTASYSKNTSDYIIVHPHFDEYRDHIIKSGYFYTPKRGSSKGRTTIEMCKLSRFASMHLPFGPRWDVDDKSISNKITGILASKNGVEELTELLSSIINSAKLS